MLPLDHSGGPERDFTIIVLIFTLTYDFSLVSAFSKKYIIGHFVCVCVILVSPYNLHTNKLITMKS